jgi:hypothetical protein
VRDLAWKKEIAITTAPRKLTSRKEWAKIAEENGISYSTFYSRLRLKWDEERAAITPLPTKEQIKEQAIKACRAHQKFPSEVLQTVDNNGISRAAFHNRIRAGWSVEDAMSKPIMTPQERGRQTKAKIIERVGKDLHNFFYPPIAATL